MLLYVYAEVLKLFNKLLALSLAEEILFRIGYKGYREILVHVRKRCQHVEILIALEVLYVYAAEVKQHLVSKIERHFLSQSLLYVVDTAIEQCGAEFELGAYAETLLKALVGCDTGKHSGIISARAVAGYAHIVKVEVIFLGIFADPVQRLNKLLQAQRKFILRS